MVFGYMPMTTVLSLLGLANVDGNTLPANNNVLLWDSLTSLWTAAPAPSDVNNNFSATRAPTENDDSTEGYSPGSVWIDTSALKSYVCTNAAVGAAVWLETTPLAQSNYAATVAPTVNDDSGSGYSVGSLWVNVTADDAYLCVNASSGAAVWRGLDVNTLNNFAASAAPTTGDDSGDGYSAGSLWVDTTGDEAYICVDASVGAAVWQNISAAAPPLNNFAATTDPTVNDDSGDGYEIGSFWVNTTSGGVYSCLSASSGAASWSRLNRPVYGFFATKLTSQIIWNLSPNVITDWFTNWSIGSPSGFNATTGVFTAPEAGYYKMTGSISFGSHSQTVGNEHSVRIIASTGQVIEVRYFSKTSGTYPVVPPIVSGMVYLPASGTVQLEAWHNTGSTSIDVASPPSTFFSLIRLRL